MRRIEDGSFDIGVSEDGEVDKALVVGRMYRVIDIWEGLYEIEVEDSEGGVQELWKGGLYPAEFFEVIDPGDRPIS